MTKFFYCGNVRENERFVNHRYHSYGRDYEKAGNSICDYCQDVFDRRELSYVFPKTIITRTGIK